MTRAGEAQRRRLNDTFVELCRIESPFGRERACGDRVAGELRGLGLEVQEDGSGPEAGSESGNLLARVPGPAERTILLCAHLDTVVPQAPIEPELDDGRWQNARDGILGADNKAAVAVILAVVRHAVEPGAPPWVLHSLIAAGKPGRLFRGPARSLPKCIHRSASRCRKPWPVPGRCHDPRLWW